jgi:hypothetical protein
MSLQERQWVSVNVGTTGAEVPCLIASNKIKVRLREKSEDAGEGGMVNQSETRSIKIKEQFKPTEN